MRAKLTRMGIQLPTQWEPPPGGFHIYPTQVAPIIRRPPERVSGDEAVPGLELVEARFGLLPGFAKDFRYGQRTYNARAETVASLASFKHAWSKGRRCIVPAAAIYEPDWRTGKHIPTRISRADGETLGIAGLWQAWKSPTGEWMNSFTMLTINADSHHIFKELHRPDLTRTADKQDKRMVAILNDDTYEAWLDAPAEQAGVFLKQFAAHNLVAMGEPTDATPALF